MPMTGANTSTDAGLILIAVWLSNCCLFARHKIIFLDNYCVD